MQNCETKIKLKPTYSEEYTVAINRPTCCMGRWVKWSEVGGWDEEDFSLPPLFFFFKPNIPGSGTCHRACSSHEQQCSPLRPHSHKAVREGTFTRIKWRPCLSWNAHTQSWLSFTHVDVFLFVCFKHEWSLMSIHKKCTEDYSPIIISTETLVCLLGLLINSQSLVYSLSRTEQNSCISADPSLCHSCAELMNGCILLI